MHVPKPVDPDELTALIARLEGRDAWTADSPGGTHGE